ALSNIVATAMLGDVGKAERALTIAGLRDKHIIFTLKDLNSPLELNLATSPLDLTRRHCLCQYNVLPKNNPEY
ncbi:Hypothetical predicted protein, partial [Paramuricea clavata]